MYATHFGLKKRPFRALATGTDVFVGPQTASTMASIKKALAAPDSIAAISGPVGAGKTTLVRHALEAIGHHPAIVTVGRMQLGHDEVLELLLEEMGAEVPIGTVQRFTTFRRLLKQHVKDDKRVFFVVEDAARIGIDALAELEALTASDAGVSEGASVVLMGDQELNEVLKAPQLVRLKQRLRTCQSISSLSSSELLGYFKHCFRLAGNEFDVIFDQGTSEVLHTLSGGIPRMANNLVESALASAAESKKDRVSIDIVRQVAKDEFGLESAAAVPAATAVAAEAPELPKPAPIEVAPVAAVREELSHEEVEDDAILELIQDTLPDLAILTPELATQSGVEIAEVPELAEQPTSEDEDVPEWERDPTLAQLRPDLDALEHAMAVAHGLEPATDDHDEQVAGPEEFDDTVPEIILDIAIQAKIEKAAESLKLDEQEAARLAESESDDSDKTETPTSKPAVQAEPEPTPTEAPAVVAKPVAEEPFLPVLELPANPVDEPAAVTEDVSDAESRQPAKKADPELEKIASNLARAKTIDDCDDEMAETLFGEAFSLMAAQVAANAPPELLADEEPDLTAEKIAASPDADFEKAAALNVELKTELNGQGKNQGTSESQRLATVRALNSGSGAPSPAAEAIAMSHYETPPPSPAAGDHPDSIEDQLNTSITQTLKALSVQPPSGDDDEDEDGKGFFSRFRHT